jgi:hypothetical protein
MFLQVCPVCEHRNPRGSRFCNECGSPLQLRFCPACHAAEDVMSLVCRSCGEKLPPLPFLEGKPAPADLQPSGENIWKADAPPPGFHLAADDGVTVTVHGGAGASRAPESAPEQIAVPVATAEPEPPLLSERIAEPVPERIAEPVPERIAEPVPERIAEPVPERIAEPVPERIAEPVPERIAEPVPAPEPAPAQDVPKTRTPTVIERLHGAPTETEVPPVPRTISLPVATESTDQDGALTPESESEIEISAEAETLVEACVAPVTYQLTEEIAVTETVRTADLSSRLREGAWRSAMSADTVTRLTPALVPVPPPPRRRLSMHRVGLAVAAVGAVAAVVYSVRLAPGTGPTAVQAAAPKAATPKATVPVAQRITRTPPSVANTVPPTAGAAAALPDTAAARSVESSPPAPQPTAPPVEEPREKAPSVPPAAAAKAEPAAPPATAPARRPAPPPATPRETAPPPVVQTRRVPVEPPRPCTPEVAALGLCTPVANQEGK